MLQQALRIITQGAAHAIGIRGRCRACGALTENTPPNELGLCPACDAALQPKVSGYCPACGQPDADHAAPRLCAQCQAESPPWDTVHFWGVYDGLLENLLLGFKFGATLNRQALLGDLATLALGYRQESRARLVVPVPLHGRRLRWRGFNQSLELSRAVARKHGLRLCPIALTRARYTTPQVNLRRAQRLTNLHAAFCADASVVKGQNVLLVDDVMTTGSTVRECSRTLLDAGALRVEVLVLARA